MQKKYIKNLGTPKYEDWDSGKRENKEIKKTIKKELMTYQNNKCAYCRLELEETSRAEIEHIAPRKKYPEYEYTKTNLVMACQFCNGSSKKGRKDTIASKGEYYNQCEFKIVHPYYDDVEHFFKYYGAIISIKESLNAKEKEKAKFTIDTFELAKAKQVEARVKAQFFEDMKKHYEVNELNEMLIKGITLYIRPQY